MNRNCNRKSLLLLVALATAVSAVAGSAPEPAEGDAIPVRNWQAPSYWAVPIPDDGMRSARVEAP